MEVEEVIRDILSRVEQLESIELVSSTQVSGDQIDCLNIDSRKRGL